MPGLELFVGVEVAGGRAGRPPVRFHRLGHRAALWNIAAWVHTVTDGLAPPDLVPVVPGYTARA